jgi:hypothetical protein
MHTEKYTYTLHSLKNTTSKHVKYEIETFILLVHYEFHICSFVFNLYVYCTAQHIELDFFLLNLRIPITKLANDSKQPLNFTHKYAM